MMQYIYHKPHHLFSEYVKTVLTAEAAVPSSDNKLPLYTSGMPALLCLTERSPAGIENVVQLTLFGKAIPESILDLKKTQTIIAYFFKPFSLSCLFNLPAANLAKQPVELAEWNAHKANALKTQLAYVKTTLEKIEALDNLLLHQLEQQKKECEIIRYATDQIMINSDTEILSVLLKKLNLNERSLQRVFKKHVGVTPNQYRRICQFKLSFDQLRSGGYDKLIDVAYNAGFSDQSHFIRSFKEFTNTTPKEYTKSGLGGKKK